MDLLKLKREALKSTRARGHKIHWAPPYHGELRSLQTGTCTRAHCSAWVQTDTRPQPNGIDIGGPAVALNCPAKEGS